MGLTTLLLKKVSQIINLKIIAYDENKTGQILVKLSEEAKELVKEWKQEKNQEKTVTENNGWYIYLKKLWDKAMYFKNTFRVLH